MAKIAKTNAARILDSHKIKYELIPYEVDEDNLAANHIAEQLGENIEQVFKTLVLRGDKTGFLVCVLPGDKELDLKKVAKASANKKVEMIAMKELLPTTGYIRGGCSPLGMKKSYDTYMHNSIQNFESVYISAGVRGTQLKLSPTHLLKITNAKVFDLVED